jgi:hypothetical protein
LNSNDALLRPSVKAANETVLGLRTNGPQKAVVSPVLVVEGENLFARMNPSRLGLCFGQDHLRTISLP